YSTCALSVTLQALRQVLLGFKAAKAELAAENAALKEQRASWELEKNMLLDEKEHLVSTLFMARRYIHSVKESLRFHKTETEKATKAWKELHHQLNEMKPSFDKAVMELKKERESRGLVTENEVAANLENLQQDSERKRSKIIQEKEEAITSDRKGVMALEEEHLEETHQRETEWQTKHKVLEGQIERDLASKEILKKSEQKQSREVEEKWLNKEEEWLNKEEEWLNKEEEWLNKEREMRDEMQLLNQKNAQLTAVVSAGLPCGMLGKGWLTDKGEIERGNTAMGAYGCVAQQRSETETHPSVPGAVNGEEEFHEEEGKEEKLREIRRKTDGSLTPTELSTGQERNTERRRGIETKRGREMNLSSTSSSSSLNLSLTFAASFDSSHPSLSFSTLYFSQPAINLSNRAAERCCAEATFWLSPEASWLNVYLLGKFLPEKTEPDGVYDLITAWTHCWLLPHSATNTHTYTAAQQWAL
ncbi:Reticulocyte-binding protein 2 like a, partial [Dissostichus eleginoides]